MIEENTSAPVLPALKEIRITRVEVLVLIFSNDASRSLGFIDPSSITHQYISATYRYFNSQRTYLTPLSFRKGSSKSSMLVNCEKIIVFSSLFDRSSMSRSNFKIMRIFADVGRSSSALRALIASGTQSRQCVFHSPSLEFADEILESGCSARDLEMSSDRLTQQYTSCTSS